VPNINNWDEWDDIEDGMHADERRDKIKHKNTKTDKQKTENRWNEPQKLVYRKKKK
jgi:hypothetical protein